MEITEFLLVEHAAVNRRGAGSSPAVGGAIYTTIIELPKF